MKRPCTIRPSRTRTASATDDAWLAMPPAPHIYDCPAAIASLLAVSPTWDGAFTLALKPARMNGQPAYACHLGGVPAGLLVLTVRDETMAGVMRFLTTS